MKLTTAPSQIRPPRSEDWIVDGVKVGTLTPTDTCTSWVVCLDLSEPRLGLFGSCCGSGPTKEEAASDCLRKLSMCSLHVSQTYTHIVAAVQS